MTAATLSKSHGLPRVGKVEDLIDDHAEPNLLELALQDHLELVEGQLLEKPWMSKKNVKMELRLAASLLSHCDEHDLGEVMSDGVSYRCFPHDRDLTRRPDVTFIAKGRTTPDMDEGHVPIHPDLVVEVVSPNDVLNQVQARVEDFRSAGTPLIWVVIPEHRMAMVYRGDGSVSRVDELGSLEGEDVLPGFSLPLAELLGAMKSRVAAG